MGGSSSSLSFDYDQQLFDDRTPQAVLVGEEVKGSSKILRNKISPEHLNKFPYAEEKGGGCKTIWDSFQRGLSKGPQMNCLGTRVFQVDDQKNLVKNSDGTFARGEYKWESYDAVHRIATAFGSGLVELGCGAKDNVGIWAINRAEWVISALALYSQSMRTVALYSTLGANAVEFIIDHAELSVVVCEKASTRKLIKSLEKLPRIQTIIQFDPNELYGNWHETVDPEDVKVAGERNVRLLGFSEVVKLGTEKGHFPVPPSDSDLAFLMYTSGTTGDPKGVMLTHGNIVGATSGAAPLLSILNTDVYISYLPLAHIFETVVQNVMMVNGASIGFFQGDIKRLTNDFVDLQPTILCGVPRVFSRIFQKVWAGVGEANFIKRWYFGKAYNGQCDALRAGLPRVAKYDNKVFSPLRNRLGLGRVRILVSGGAPLPSYLDEFLRVVVGSHILQGFGLTETSAATAVVNLNDRNVGHIGPPLTNNECKLVDVAEMGYLTTDKPHPRGELCVRGANVFIGYFKNEEATRECLDADGWFHTGDIARFNPNGTISIIDRKKNIFKLSQGEYVAAEKIESVYSRSPACGQIWIYGNSLKSFLLAVLVPSGEYVANYCVENGWWPRPKDQIRLGTQEFADDFRAVLTGSYAQLIKQHLLGLLAQQAGELKGFEKIKDLIIESNIDSMMQGFTESNDCLTPTFKLRRKQLLDRYKAQLKALYAQHGEPDQEGEKWPGDK